MGVTSAGKSSSILMCTNKVVKIGHYLKSCIISVENIALILNDRICVHLICSPRFDDTLRSDVQVLQDLHWFSRSFEEGTRLSGMIYLHRITDVRMTGSARRNLVMFQKLCGENAFSSVVLATTMWNLVEEATDEQRERELIESDEFWGYMHNQFNQGHQIEETKAGLQLNEDILRERKKYQAELQAMKEKMHETMALNNAELQRIFREENIRLKEEEQAKLKQDLKEVQARKDYEFEEFKRQLTDMERARKRYDDNNRRMEEFLNSKQKESYKELINGNHMEVYKPQSEEEELLKGDQKEAYIRPANGYTSHGEQNINSDDTPLHAAVRNRKPDVVGFLLDNGGNVKSKDKLGNTPLHLATMTGQANIAKRLLDRRAKISERNNNYNTPLHLAVQNGQIETAKLLLVRQADIEMSDYQDNTPLHLAAWSGSESIAKLLFKGGAKIEAKNKSGNTPLHLAALNGKVDVVKLLRKGGADVEAKDTDGNTPLHLASLAGKVDVTKLLLGQRSRWWSGW
ncbi:hypothetical protein TGAM01_v204406 [Trichoderma gamsii]|uniref:Uncharacterized protein n=1 Tax=Trichoderma gamsii TaxID=398673 RepID=A0A2P4ZRH9_9HYPO|nr:hypothetical protein TGAM01_v204406 [Trichoderma gamsii]PON26905.1 hypothetical protein TGAM01_v204406 [Trichoderma gamsii]